MNFLRPSTQSRVSIITAIIPIVWSLYFIFSWPYVLSRHQYVRSLPGIPLSAGVLFLFSGVALLLLELDLKAIARALGLITATISLLDFLKDMFGFGFDIDAFLSEVFYATPERHFFRLAPNTSVAFFCAGVAIFLLSGSRRKEFSTFIANLLGGFSLALGAVSLFGYTAGVVTAYSWRGYVGMSIYTASFFVVLGLGICLHALQRVSLRRRRVHTPMLVALCFVAIVLQLYRAQSVAEIKSIQESTNDRALDLGHQLSLNLDEHISSLIRMGKRWDVMNGMPRLVWDSDVTQYSEHLHGYSHLQWVNAKGELMWDRWIGDGPSWNPAINPAHSLSEPTVSVQTDHRSIIAEVAITSHGKPDGWLVGTISLDQLLAEKFDLSAYSLDLYWKGSELYRSNSENFDSAWTKYYTFMYRGVELRMNLTPKPQQMKKYESRLPMTILFFGLGFAWILGYGTYLYFLTRENEKLSQERLAWEQAISIGSDLIFVTVDQQGMVRSFNPAAEKFFDYSADEVVNRMTPLVWHDQDELAEHFEKMSRDLGRTVPHNFENFVARAKLGAVDRHEWTFLTKTGRKKKGELSLHVLKSRRNEVVGYVGIVRDVTEQRRAEEQLVQSSKMASLGEMAGGVAHEINNPLTIIQGRATRLMQLSERNEGVPPEVLRESLRNIVETSRRIAKIVKGLATFSRNAEFDELEPTELGRILEDTLELCRERFHENGIALEVLGIPDVVIFCRPTQISQVLLNLLNNAFDAVKPLPDRWVRIDIEIPPGNIIQICVTDSGSGIPKEVADRMMEPFYTTKGVGAGTGLGLSISKGIIESHNGRLMLDQKAKHTRFILELPYHLS